MGLTIHEVQSIYSLLHNLIYIIFKIGAYHCWSITINFKEEITYYQEPKELKIE